MVRRRVGFMSTQAKKQRKGRSICPEHEFPLFCLCAPSPWAVSSHSQLVPLTHSDWHTQSASLSCVSQSPIKLIVNTNCNISHNWHPTLGIHYGAVRSSWLQSAGPCSLTPLSILATAGYQGASICSGQIISGMNSLLYSLSESLWQQAS